MEPDPTGLTHDPRKTLPIEHKSPKNATVKRLYGTAEYCAFPSCSEPLFRESSDGSSEVLNSRICHINARREGGPRWDPSQSEEDNRSFDNLILMCLKHASEIDDPAQEFKFSASLLREWKNSHTNRGETKKSSISKQQIDEIVRVSFGETDTMVIGSNVTLGGQGGQALGAGGGGGGAIGQGAVGGSGGRGGDVFILGGVGDEVKGKRVDTSLLRDLLSSSTLSAKAADSSRGGAATGAIGSDAIGGDGGGGGDIVTGKMAVQSGDRIRVSVGEGGRIGKLPGQHGMPGQETMLEHYDRDGRLLKTISASGGKGGRSGNSYLPRDVAELTSLDLKNGVDVKALIPVNDASLENGLLNFVGGGWNHCILEGLPSQQVWSVVIVIDIPESCRGKGIFLSLYSPSGNEISSIGIALPTPQVGVRIYHFLLKVGATIDELGGWLLRVHSGGVILSEYRIDVRVDE